MRQRAVGVATIAGTAILALTVSGCSSSSKSSGSGGSAAPSSSSSGSTIQTNELNPGYTTKGGVIKVLMASDFEHLDPGQNYVTASQNIGRLINRTLTWLKEEPNKPPQIVPDLATDIGKVSADGKTWTYTLKDGIKYEDGTPVTSADIKYAVSRMWDATIANNGAPYMTQLLDQSASYKGPYATPNVPFTGVTTPDAKTVVFHLLAPNSDFPWIVSLPYTSPVPKAGDTANKEDTRPESTGPYKIKSYVHDKELIVVRNTNWDASTDPNRLALPDEFDFSLSGDLPTISQQLIGGDAAYQNALTLENSGAIQNSDIAKIQQPSVKARYANGPTVCVDYVFLNTQRIKDPNVRKAIAQAVNRQAVQTQYGGNLFAAVANTAIPPSLNGYNPPDLGLKPAGDAAAAKSTLGSTTVPTLTFGVSSKSVKGLVVGQQVQNDLKGIGVTVNIVKIPADSYYTTLAGPNAPDMGRAGWCPDWPSSASVVPPIFGPDPSGKSFAPQNYSKFVDQTSFAAMAKIAGEKATTQAQIDDLAKQWNDLNNTIQQQYPIVPLVLDLDPNVVGSKLQNVWVSPQWASIDLNSLGVKP
jgi:peptide/nickel transport system substrate-binding protein